MNIHSLYAFLNRRIRTKRMKRFVDTFHPSRGTTILDVGGTPRIWKLITIDCRVTLLNLKNIGDTADHREHFDFVEGNATDLQYPDEAFDICFSNSVIEHLYTYENQAKFAKEVRRVGKRLWIETPARFFFVEPHLLAPFVHFLPKSWQKRLIRNFTVRGLITRPSPEWVERFLEEVRLLTLREMQELFPDCEIHKEKLLFLTKSYIAIR